MKKRLQGLVAGVLAGVLLTTGVCYAANTTTLYDVMTNGIRIVLDGKELNPTDVNGNSVEPFVYNGTTYLPVRAIATAMGKAVYWDGPEFTVYLGDMDGKLEYPTKELTEKDNIGDRWYESDNLKDNYGNFYTRAITTNGDDKTFEALCGMKYSRLTGVAYVTEGYSGDESTRILIKADGKTVYKSPEIDKRSAPVYFDVDITGCNDLEIVCTYNLSDFWGDYSYINLGELSLYQ